MTHPAEHRPGMPPTPRQLACFRACCEARSRKQAAADLGITYQSLKNVLSGLYVRLGVSSDVEALFALGWLRFPAPTGAAQATGTVPEVALQAGQPAPPPPRQDQQEVS